VQVNTLPDFLVFTTALCKLFGARIVLDMHECTPELFCTKYMVGADHPVVKVLGWVEQISLGFAHQVITCTPQQRDIFASRGTPAGKIEVVLNAANSAVFRPRTLEPLLWEPGAPGQTFELVSHGLVAQRYGPDTMVQAVALLASEIPGIRLHIYGKGDYLPQVREMVNDLGVGDKVVVHGFVSEEELLEGIARAHVGVIAAKRDSFRNLTHTQKMYEYVAMRKPVVIAETPAVRTHFDDSCFQFFASDDPADLARALRELYYDPLRAVDMVNVSSQRYRAYSWEAQRLVYRDAVLGTGLGYEPALDVPQERPVHVGPPVTTISNVANVPVSAQELDLVGVAVAVEAAPAPLSLELSTRATPAESGKIFMDGTIMPESDVNI
jgi:glycosyltransferase involved in cell wall biosynthesis